MCRIRVNLSHRQDWSRKGAPMLWQEKWNGSARTKGMDSSLAMTATMYLSIFPPFKEKGTKHSARDRKLSLTSSRGRAVRRRITSSKKNNSIFSKSPAYTAGFFICINIASQWITKQSEFRELGRGFRIRVELIKYKGGGVKKNAPCG